LINIGGRKMIIEVTIFVALVLALGASVVKIYEWRRDVLFGPYLKRDSRFDTH
jgi:hypothetical protein